MTGQLLRAADRTESLLLVEVHGGKHVQRLHGTVEKASNTCSVHAANNKTRSLYHSKHATVYQRIIHARSASTALLSRSACR
jgi:hypothetical protein